MNQSTTLTPNTDLKVYRPTSIIDNWPYHRYLYRDFKVTWLMWTRDEPLGDYYQLIDGYPTDRRWIDTALLDELFTRSEAAWLTRYLKDAHDTDVTLTEKPLPIKSRTDDGVYYMSLSGTAFGGGVDVHMLWMHDDYNLPFKVGGYFNVEGMTPAKVLACRQDCNHEHHTAEDYADYTGQPTEVDSFGFLLGADGNLHEV